MAIKEEFILNLSVIQYAVLSTELSLIFELIIYYDLQLMLKSTHPV